MHIEVTDTAGGIPDDIMPNLFETFYTTKGPGKGTGLGLSISRQIIESHKGTLTVDSILGQGSTFLIKIPVETT